MIAYWLFLFLNYNNASALRSLRYLMDNVIASLLQALLFSSHLLLIYDQLSFYGLKIYRVQYRLQMKFNRDSYCFSR